METGETPENEPGPVLTVTDTARIRDMMVIRDYLCHQIENRETRLMEVEGSFSLGYHTLEGQFIVYPLETHDFVAREVRVNGSPVNPGKQEEPVTLERILTKLHPRNAFPEGRKLVACDQSFTRSQSFVFRVEWEHHGTKCEALWEVP